MIAYLLSGLIWRSGGDWRTLFWMLTVASALDLFLTFAFIKETPRIKGLRVDYVGCIGLVAWTVLMLLPLSQANSWGWGSTKLLGLLLPGVALLIALGRVGVARPARSSICACSNGRGRGRGWSFG